MNRREFLRAVGITSVSLPFISLKTFSANLEVPEESRCHGMYRIAREAFMNGDIDWEKDKVRVALVNGDRYLPDRIKHKSLRDVPRNKIVATSNPLKGKTLEGLILDADDVWVTSIYGKTIHYLILYRPARIHSSSLLIACVGAGFFPVVPNGGDMKIEWDNGEYKICSL